MQLGLTEERWVKVYMRLLTVMFVNKLAFAVVMN
jgi:hypothetical protein